MAFPPSNAEKVYERMVAELNKQAIEYQAQGLAEANTIRAEGMQAAAKERADAQAEAQGIRGKGDAEALSILAKVQTDDRTREFYQYWKSLEFLKTSLTKNTILVLPSNAEILQNLFQSPKNERSILPLANPADALKAAPANVTTQPAK
jgi:membrane protease subunit HflC